MRALVQRVSRASVTAAPDAQQIAAIGPGLLMLLGIHRDDGEQEADRLSRKLLTLRVFEDDDGRMNRSVGDVGGEVLCVSQFTLLGDTRRGNRPSFADVAPPRSPSLCTNVCERGLARAEGASVPTWTWPS